MTMRRDPMWDDEERKLAAQLARIAPHGEPSADLDARILAMAERDLAGVSPTATQRRRRTHRWPVWLGAAASLTVVAGLVWQLQPVLEPRQTIRYEAPASVDSDNDPNGKRQPIAYVESAAATDASIRFCSAIGAASWKSFLQKMLSVKNFSFILQLLCVHLS